MRRRREEITDPETVLGLMTAQTAQDEFEDESSELEKMLDAAKTRAKGVVIKGIDAIKLMAQGYKCREIGELMGGVSANDVTAWVAKARAFLKEDPDIAALRDII